MIAVFASCSAVLSFQHGILLLSSAQPNSATLEGRRYIRKFLFPTVASKVRQQVFLASPHLSL
jgi:hypothetical protein